MHELPVIQSLFDICMKHARTNNARKIISVTIKVGEASDLQEEWIQRYYEFLCKDTIAEGSQLVIERVPLVVRCKGCEEEFHVNLREAGKVQCPKCARSSFQYVSGREYSVESMQIV